MTAEPRPRGRPIGWNKPGRTQTRITVRLTDLQAETFAALGGSEWLRTTLDRAAKRSKSR